VFIFIYEFFGFHGDYSSECGILVCETHLIARQEHIGGLLVSTYKMTLSLFRRPKSGFIFLFIGNRVKHKAAY